MHGPSASSESERFRTSMKGPRVPSLANWRAKARPAAAHLFGFASAERRPGGSRGADSYHVAERGTCRPQTQNGEPSLRP